MIASDTVVHRYFNKVFNIVWREKLFSFFHLKWGGVSQSGFLVVHQYSFTVY